MLFHVADQRAALRELRRVLKPGGRLVLTAPVNPGSSTPASIARVRARSRGNRAATVVVAVAGGGE